MDGLEEILGYAADGLLIFASLGAALFCLVLSRRLSQLSRIDNGLGGAIAVLSAQVDDMNSALAELKSGTSSSAERLEELNREARQLSEELELMLAACHDMDPAAAKPEPEPDIALDLPLNFVEEPEELAVFGSRRHQQAPAENSDPAIPFFLQNRSRLAEVKSHGR